MQDNDNDSESVYSYREEVCDDDENGEFERTPFEEILCSFRPSMDVEVNKSQTIDEGEKENQLVFV